MMPFLEVYSILVPILTAAALLYAGIEDLLYREVRREIVWVLMIGIGVILDVLYLALYNGARTRTDVLAEMLLTIVVAFIFGFVLFYIGAWGGADAKALWSIAILTPLHPFLEFNGTLIDIGFVFADDYIWVLDSSIISILLNSGLIAIFYPLALICVNAISATRTSLFEEVRGTTSQKIRCFVFGFKKKVEKINPKKLHFDFLETLPEKNFRGKFEGSFTGELDGKFIGLLKGKITGQFTGKIYGQLLSESPDNQDVDVIIKEAEKLSTKINVLGKYDEDEEIDLQLLKYQEMFSLQKEESSRIDDLACINFDGQLTEPFEGHFLGSIDGLLHGSFEGEIMGKLKGDLYGESPKGKLTGSTSKQEEWQLTIRSGLDEDTIMEKRQLRTLWQLQNTKKKSVWVTPGIPFVFLMLLGYILYILVGNLALYLFRL
jgi:preflagellin peptidase FlaK